MTGLRVTHLAFGESVLDHVIVLRAVAHQNLAKL